MAVAVGLRVCESCGLRSVVCVCVRRDETTATDDYY